MREYKDQHEEEQKKLKKQDRDRMNLYRRVFLDSDDGKLVLYDILNQLQFWSFEDGGEKVLALQNEAKRILYKTGIFRADTFLQIIQSISNISTREVIE